MDVGQGMGRGAERTGSQAVFTEMVLSLVLWAASRGRVTETSTGWVCAGHGNGFSRDALWEPVLRTVTLSA